MKQRIDEIIVEWDTAKDNLNIKKHGLCFKTAALVFADKNRVELYDFKHSAKEDRFMVIGLVNNLITVVYTERVDALRIISARVATEAERRIYYEQNS